MVTPTEPTVYEFDNFRLDVEKRLLWNGDDEPIPLRPKVFDTLLFLIVNRGKLIDKNELMSAIWQDTIVEENNLNKNISTLRQVLGENPHQHRFIVTVPGKGYKFVAPVREVRESDEPAPADRRDQESNPIPVYDRSGGKEPNRFWLLTLLFIVAAGLLVIGFYGSLENATSGPIKAVAVIPFTNASGDPEMDYFAEGISENLLDRLSELPDLKVIARTSSLKYKGDELNLNDIAEKLNVQAIVTGRVAKKGDELSVRVELIDVRENKQIWGQEFHRKAGAADAFEGEISRSISERLLLKLTPSQADQLVRRGTDNHEAYELVLKGDFLAQRLATRERAFQLYERAVQLDPLYALAHSRLADTLLHLAAGNKVEPSQVLSRIRSAAERSVELDPGLSDGHLVLAKLARSAWDWQTAESEFKRALELAPNSVEANQQYRIFLGIMGRHEEALARARRVRELDPLSIQGYHAVPSALLLARRFDEAIEEATRALEVDQSFGLYFYLGVAYFGKGAYRQAIDAFEESIRRGNTYSHTRIALGAAYANAGEREKAIEILKSLETSGEYVSPGELPVLYAALGEKEKAIAMLEKAFESRDLQLQHLNVDVGFDPLREDPRFRDLVRRVGLPH